MIHASVLLHEALDGLDIRDGDVIIDGTLGNGGHSEAMFQLGKDIQIIGIDLDGDAIARSKIRLAPFAERMIYVEDSFRNIASIIQDQGFANVSKILFDFGLSSNQIEESKRGFSFQRDEPLIMTFRSKSGSLTAKEVVNNWEEESLQTIIHGFGEERFAGRIARGIVETRLIRPITTTGQLVDIIKGSTPSFYHKGKIHPATRTFQAIRIAVNDELEAIKEGLAQGFDALLPKGRMAAISFHSLEDRIVKHYFRSLSNEDAGILHTKRPITAQDSELKQNPRSRSAKLRIIEKI